MKKLLKYIFIPVLAILLMSHNVFAVDMSPNVHPIWTNATPDCTFYTRDGSTFYNDLFNGTAKFLSISYISCAVPAGLQSNKTYAVYSFILDNIPDNNSLDAGFRAMKARHGSGGDGGWGAVGVEVSSIGNNGAKVDFYLYGEKSNTTAGTVVFYNSYNANELFYIEPQERITVSGASYWQVDTTDFEYNYTDVLNAISNKVASIQGDVNSIRTGLWTLRNDVMTNGNKIDNIGEDVANNINDSQSQATQGASDNSSTSANNNSSDQTTSNLLGVFGSFVTAITSISPSNCNVDFDLGHIDFGVQNLCSQPVPQAFTVVTSIIVVCFTIPFVVHLIRRILSLIREMQT